MTTKDTTIFNPETGEIIGYQMNIQFRTPYNYDRDAVSLETGTKCEEETLAQQQFKDECDINTILDRFGITGELPTNVRQPLSADFVEAVDYQTAQNALIEAQQSFMEMPAKIREKFDNNPAKFIDFFEHEENRAEAERLGLVMPRPTEERPTEPPEGAPKA